MKQLIEDIKIDYLPNSFVLFTKVQVFEFQGGYF